MLPIFLQHLEFVKNNKYSLKKGQTLITLLIFILVAITIATTSVSILISNAQNTSGTSQSIEAYYAAEAGIENASMRLLRDPEYTGEVLQISSDVSATISVSHNGHYEVISSGKSGGIIRVIQANLDYTNNILQVVAWKEIYQ